jgi:hypothetical protein
MDTSARALGWSGPYSFREVIRERKEELSRKGIYVWRQFFPRSEKWRVVYVGRSQNMWKRHCNHYKLLVGGAYRLEGPEAEADKPFWTATLDNPEYFDPVKFGRVVETAFQHSKDILLWFLPVEGADLPLLEHRYQYLLQPVGSVPGTKSDPGGCEGIAVPAEFVPPTEKKRP